MQQLENNTFKIVDLKINKFYLAFFSLMHVNTALTQDSADEVHRIIGADILESGKVFFDYDNYVLYLKKA